MRIGLMAGLVRYVYVYCVDGVSSIYPSCNLRTDQAIRTEFIEEFAHIEHVQSGKTKSSMNSARIAWPRFVL